MSMRKSILKNAAEILILLVLSLVMVAIPLTHYICIIKGKYYSYIAKTIYSCSVLIAASVVFTMFVYRKNITLSRYEVVFGVMIGFLLLSWRNALNPYKALFGESGRNEGLFMLLCYYLTFYTARLITNEKIRTRVVNIFIIIMAIHALYGLGQFYELTWLPFIHDYYHYAISGVAGNPNFMGSLMVMACGACVGMAIYSQKMMTKVIYVLLFPVFAATLIFTKTMSAYMGLAMILLTVFIIAVKFVGNRKGWKTAAAFVAIVAVTGAILLVIVDKLAYGIISIEIINQLKNGINIETFASGRLMVWINIFKMLPEYLPFGVGIDGLQQPYFDRYGLLFGTYLDKAHNELIHILITMGPVVLICCLLIYFFIAKDLSAKIKNNSNKPVNMALMMIIIGYLTQAMFNISVIDVAPYFWIMLGLAAKPLIEEK